MIIILNKARIIHMLEQEPHIHHMCEFKEEEEAPKNTWKEYFRGILGHLGDKVRFFDSQVFLVFLKAFIKLN